MHHFLVLGVWWIIPCFLLFTLAAASGEISINCGSTGTSAEVDGREWIGDKQHPDFKIHGSSTRSSVISAAPVPYETARISRSQFSYIFHVNSGQTFIRLHFNPTSYHGYERYEDLFTVEAGQFTLLSNFSASITADALSVSYFVKEFCIVIEENQPLSITFSPASDHSQHTYVFINGIEIISLPESLSCSHTGDIGVQVVGQKSIVYIDNGTALEVVHRRNLNRASVSSGDDFRRMFGRWTTSLDKKVNKVNNITWRIPVDVGFRYLVRLHFCELGLKLTESGQKNFLFLIDHVIATTDTEIFHQRVDKHSLLYMNYVVIAKGRKQEGKRDILISLQSKENFIHRHGPLEGFEIFKLSNHDNSLASPNPLPLTRESPSLLSNFHLPIPGGRNTIATVLITVICLVNIVVHILRETCESIFPEEENKPSTKTTRLCRCFSLAEIQSATKNFNDEFIIGKGGFGIVYKGIIIDNGKKTVTFKRLKPESKQGKREFCTEIETLSELRHINLVSLIGYCNEQGEMILVYAYMPNGTLADHLYKLVRKNKKFSSLTWEERLKICIGAGRGLDYLHTGQGVIHRDVKASNILLDETFVAKVSDFGLAKSEKEMQLQSQESSNPKGTFGYFDPDYFRTSNLTTKSDTYSFGVVLLEVLCGRPAVDPLVEEDMRSLTMWARDNINRGEVDKIVAPSLIGEISPDSLKTFLGIVEKCLHNEPKRRPTIAYVVINLEMALEQQNDKWSSPNEIASVSDFLPYTDQTRRESTKSLLHNELSGVTQPLPRTDRTLMSTQDLTMLSSNMQNTTSLMKDGTSSRMVNAEPLFGKKEGKKNIMRKLSRLLLWDTTTWKKTKQSKNYGGSSISEPMSKKTSNETSSRFNGFYPIQLLSKEGVGNDSISTPNFRIFSFSELNAATKNFRADAVLGQGGFGIVYKGCLEEKSRNGNGSVSFIAIKRLNPTSVQGFKEWLSEVTFLGKLSHPNLVKLLGYCSDNQELLLVYEFIEKGSLERHLYQKSSAVQTLPWNIRLKILIGAARGLAYLHTLDSPIIYRDFKTSNILLDGLYNVKLSDFGLAKSGPSGDSTHVSTRVMGTYGYAAPEYVATGHLYVKSDVYSFGVLLIEMLTGLRAIDVNRPPRQKNLIEWIKPQLNDKKKLNRITDARLEGRYPLNSTLKMYHLARNCLEVDPKKRPSMSEVVETLERIDLVNEKPRELRVRFINQSGQDGRESLK